MKLKNRTEQYTVKQVIDMYNIKVFEEVEYPFKPPTLEPRPKIKRATRKAKQPTAIQVS